MPDLYDVLGIDKAEATVEALRRAWKRRVKTAHPDAGGTPEEFALVQTALMVLSDPVKRARYDRTGEYDAEPEPDNTLAAAHQIIADCLEAIIYDATTADDAIARINMVARIRKAIAEGRQQLNDHTKANKRLRKRAERLYGRFLAREDGKPHPLIERMLKRRVEFLDEEDAKTAARLTELAEADALIEGLTFKHEEDVDVYGELVMRGKASLYADAQMAKNRSR